MDRSDIRAKAMVLFRRGDNILVSEIREKDGVLKGYRLPGGHVEFDELSIDTARREIKEELNADLSDMKLLGVLENRFTYHDKKGHEIIFVYEAFFEDKALYEYEVIEAVEHSDNSAFKLYWIDPRNIPTGLGLFPDGLLALIS